MAIFTTKTIKVFFYSSFNKFGDSTIGFCWFNPINYFINTTIIFYPFIYYIYKIFIVMIYLGIISRLNYYFRIWIFTPNRKFNVFYFVKVEFCSLLLKMQRISAYFI